MDSAPVGQSVALTAPIAGTVLQVNARMGQPVGPTDTLVVVKTPAGYATPLADAIDSAGLAEVPGTVPGEKLLGSNGPRGGATRGAVFPGGIRVCGRGLGGGHQGNIGRTFGT